MGVDLSETKWHQYVKLQERVNYDLGNINFVPNNNQFGCAVAALCDKRKPRTIISVPTGKGKSRVIAAVVALANYDGEKAFTIVYSSELLKSVDCKKYELLEQLLKVEITQVVFDH